MSPLLCITEYSEIWKISDRSRPIHGVGVRELDYEHICAYKSRMRRKPGTLLPLESAICAAAAQLSRRRSKEFYGYQLAKHIANESGARPLAFGTLYRALGRLERMGLLDSRWEDSAVPEKEGRPGRRLYLLTATGEVAAREAAHALAHGTAQAIPGRPVPA